MRLWGILRPRAYIHCPCEFMPQSCRWWPPECWQIPRFELWQTPLQSLLSTTWTARKTVASLNGFPRAPKNIKVLSHGHCFPCTPQCQSLDICTCAQRMLNVKRCCKLHQNVLILSMSLFIFPPFSSHILGCYSSALQGPSLASCSKVYHIGSSFTFISPKSPTVGIKMFVKLPR